VCLSDQTIHLKNV